MYLKRISGNLPRWNVYLPCGRYNFSNAVTLRSAPEKEQDQQQQGQFLSHQYKDNEYPLFCVTYYVKIFYQCSLGIIPEIRIFVTAFTIRYVTK
jgi:hypothetical protein